MTRSATTPHSALVELLAPSRCLSCRARAAMPWCRRCAAEVRQLDAGCPRCACPPGGAHPCWPTGAPVDGTLAAFDYTGAVAAAIRSAKLDGAHAGWCLLAQRLVDRIAERRPDVDVVSWITTPPQRTRRREGDHAEVIARSVAASLGLPVLRLLHAQERADGRGDEYAPVRTRGLPGTHVLLVDDVLTTGATAWAAGSVLRRMGAGAILLAVLARAGTHELGPPPVERTAMPRARRRLVVRHTGGER